MIIKGKLNKAKIFTEVIEKTAIEQIRAMCDSETFVGSKIRIMPDVHTGVSCTIGTTMTIIDKIVPNMVGVDIGCGMDVVELREREIDLPKLDALIYERIPSGMNRREIPHRFSERAGLENLRCKQFINEFLALHSIGTLGGGNHFIEVDKDDEGKLYLVVHSGSRHLGSEVANYYQAEGYKQMSGNAQYQINQTIQRLKEEGDFSKIQDTIDRLRQNQAPIDKDLAYVSGKLFKDYIHDMRIVQNFAVLSRKAMLDEIISGLNLTEADRFTTIHNYIDTDNMILRKGAVSAKKGEKLLIPINMRDGALICIGKGNKDWNNSAPHGAGRLLSRGKARATLSMDEFKAQMQGIYTTSVNKSTLDESPMAYKSITDIVDNISPTVDIYKIIKPIYNFKSSEEVD